MNYLNPMHYRVRFICVFVKWSSGSYIKYDIKSSPYISRFFVLLVYGQTT